MKKLIAISLMMLTAGFAGAHPTCGGKVVSVIDDGKLRLRYGDMGTHNICNLYGDKLNTCERWMNMALISQATGKKLYVQYWGEGKTCSDVVNPGSWGANLTAIAVHLADG